MMTSVLKISAGDSSSFTEDEMKESFPEIDPGVTPFGSRLVVQIRSVRNKTKGGIITVTETKEMEKWNTQVAKVIAIGPLAFHNRDTMKEWPEGAWAKLGDFVRVPKYLQDRWEVGNGDTGVLFMIVNDLDILGKLTCSPLAVKAYI